MGFFILGKAPTGPL